MRTITEHVSRGFDNAMANWPLALLIMVARFAMGVCAVIGVMIAVVPIVVAGVLSLSSLQANDPVEAAANILVMHPLLVGYVLLVLLIVSLPLLAIVSFTEAGKAVVLLDAEALPQPLTRDGALQRFDAKRWWNGGVTYWWREFILINLVWAVGALLMLLPLLVIAATLWFTVGQGSDSLVVPCGVAVATIPFFFLIALGTGAWTQLATLELVSGNVPPATAMRRGWRILVAHPSQTMGTALLLTGIIVAVMLMVIVLQFALGAGSHIPPIAVALVPAQILASLAQSVFTSFFSLWSTAAFASLFNQWKESSRTDESTGVPQ